MKRGRVLDLTRKEKKFDFEVAEIYNKNESSICEIVKKEKELHVTLVLHLNCKSYSNSV